MSAGASVAAAASMRAEKRIVETLRSGKALSADTAMPLHPSRLIQRAVLRRLVRRSVVIEAAPEAYWLDEAGYAAMRKQRQGRLFLLLFGLAIVLIFAIPALMARP